MHRRHLLKGLAAATATAAAPFPRIAAATSVAAPQTLGQPQAFDYAWLKGQARQLAQAPYQAPNAILPAPIADLDYDRYQSIRFKRERSLWAGHDLRFRVQFFHPGFLFKERVRVFEVVEGRAQELAYDPDMFDLRKAGVAAALPRDLGFAGLRIQHHVDWENDVASFLGASYFRAVGADRQYGLSARGLAIDAGSDKGEEFPRFTAFWLERPAPGAGTMTVYALLDSPSIAGAYRIDLQPGGAMTMDIDAALYPRKAVDRLGIAPLTSMYLVGENDRRMGNDWRPEIHDSDGLSMLTGAGEWIWRPLTNPAGIRLYSFLDKNPRGFGLMQRDRDFDHYQDDGVYYERRPSLWVLPKPTTGSEGWGAGSVQLLELPAPDETFDNIVAAWTPAEKPQPGRELLLGYRLVWGTRLPFDPPLARVVATRTGIGGVVGQKRKHFSWRFAIDFQGGALPSLVQRARTERAARIEAVVTASRGRTEIVSARPQFEIDGYRAMFDLRPDDAAEPVDLRLFLRLDGEALSETWLYQWVPPAKAERERLTKEG